MNIALFIVFCLTAFQTIIGLLAIVSLMGGVDAPKKSTITKWYLFYPAIFIQVVFWSVFLGVNDLITLNF